MFYLCMWKCETVREKISVSFFFFHALNANGFAIVTKTGKIIKFREVNECECGMEMLTTSCFSIYPKKNQNETKKYRTSSTSSLKS